MANVKLKNINTDCSVPQCESREAKDPELSFYKFPSERSYTRKLLPSGEYVNVSRREEWRRILRIGKITKNMLVCAKHFYPEDFVCSMHYPRKCPQLKGGSGLRNTAVPRRCLPMTLPENSKEGERENHQIIENHNIDTECSSLKSGIHQENTLKSPRKNQRKNKKYLGSECDDTVCDIEPISLGENVKNKQPITKEMTENESISDSEEDSELSLQETFFDPSTFSIPADNPEDFLKRKLESVTELYERSWKKMKLYQRKCKLYAKQSIALKEVIENLKQINSVPNDL